MDILLKNSYDINVMFLKHKQEQISTSKLTNNELIKVGNETLSKDEYIARQNDLLKSATDILMQNSQAYLYKGGLDMVGDMGVGYGGQSSYYNNMPAWAKVLNSNRITREEYNKLGMSHESYGYGFSIGLSESSTRLEQFTDSGYFKGNKSDNILEYKQNLNRYAKEKTIKTQYGDVEVFLDLYGDNDKLGIGNFSSNALLFNFDSNADGILNSSDKLFSKLKVRGYDKDGNEKIANLSDVTKGIDLAQFIKKEINADITRSWVDDINASLRKLGRNEVDTSKIDNRMFYYQDNPYTTFSAESRYQKIDRSDTKKFFDTYVNKDGWVDLRNNNIFNKDSGFNNFAYEKVGFDGKLKLSEFNPILESDTPKDKNFSYTGYQRSSFMKFYNDYNKELDAHTKDIEWLSKNLKDYDVENADEYISKLKDSKSSYMLAMENEFKKATGLEFSLSNLEKVKRAFESDSNKAALSLNDSDSVIAMRMNSNGTITLKFDSGREIDVRDLYTDTGRLNTSGDKRASINLEAKNMSKEELNSLDFETIAIKQDDKFVSLKELGATAISKIMKNNELRFLIHLANNNIISSNELYNISYLNHTLNSNDKQIQDKDRFYKRVDVRV
ncbi:response regulator [Campylobacter sp. RM16192]|uniref:response regulator n=1 Tax=Campylobacter sp. RM16192 TaxID=1660080 RepID=UPI0014521440|nr:response regulator [Campylobacter sp. RM16192]QCD53153.1 hypothetical protein CDOMC_1557 [Campylobacter sp. RM16192]